MKNNFNLNGNITIHYKNEILMDALNYRLLNLILTDEQMLGLVKELHISRGKAMQIIHHMNRLAPRPVVEIEKDKNEPTFRVSDFGMMLLNSYAQKEFELYIFLNKSNQHLNNSFMTMNETRNSLMAELH